MTESDDATLAFYDTRAANYADYALDPQDLTSLKRFMAEVSAGGAVCDLGSGGGDYAAQLRDAGFDVTAVDGSAGLAAEAKRRHDIDVQVLRFEDFAFVDAFDGIWAAWSLHHAHRDAFPELLGRVGASLRSGGVLFLAMKGGTGEKRDDLDRLYAYYEMDELLRLAQERVGGDVLMTVERDGQGFDGSETPLLSLMLRKTT